MQTGKGAGRAREAGRWGRLAGVLPKRWRLVRELLLVSLAALTYAGVRALTEGSTAAAVANGRRLLDVERTLGVAWEERLQAWVLPHDTLVAAANWIYIWGHWPVIVAVAVLLYRYRPASYRLLRNAVFISGAIGFLFFALLPLAPPRLLDVELVDTVLDRSTAYRALQPPALTNQYAAFPSLHFGWNLLVGVVLFTTCRRPVIRAFAIGMPLAMGLAVVATANHFVLDVFAGGLVVVVGLAVATALVRRPSPTLDGDVEDSDDEHAYVAVRRRAPGRQRSRAPAGRRGAGHLARRG